MRRRILGYAGASVLACLAIGGVLARTTSGSGHTASRLADVAGYGLPAPATAASSADAAGSGGGTTASSVSGADVRSLPLSRARIVTVSLEVAIAGSARVAVQADAAIALVQSVGGAVDEDNRTGGEHASAVLRLRVPPDQVQPTLAKLSHLGAEKSREQTSVDVTGQVADVNSRVQSAEAAITRLRTLYDHAQKVSDVLAVESELSSREADLEALQAQQRTLLQHTALATIALTLHTAAPVVPVPRRHGGFLGGVERGWHAFVTAAAWSAAAVGAGLPFVVLLAASALGLRAVRRRLGRRHPPTPAPATQ